MGFFNALLGNAGAVSIEEVQNEWGKLLAPDEEISAAFKLIRDYIILTPKRIIFINYRGFTGTQIEILSYPYRSIIGFSIQTAGIMDLNASLFITVANRTEPIMYKFDRSTNIYEVQAIIADAIARFD